MVRIEPHLLGSVLLVYHDQPELALLISAYRDELERSQEQQLDACAVDQSVTDEHGKIVPQRVGYGFDALCEVGEVIGRHLRRK